MFANLLVLPALVLTTAKWSGKRDASEEPAMNVLRSNVDDEDEGEENQEK